MKNFNSIKKNIEFKNVYSKKNSFATKNLILYVMPTDMEVNRIGISVSAKIGNSVVRHTITRRIREIFREVDKNLKKSFDMIVVIRKAETDYNYNILKKDYIFLCKKQKIYKELIND